MKRRNDVNKTPNSTRSDSIYFLRKQLGSNWDKLPKTKKNRLVEKDLRIVKTLSQ